jgi:hypothetical protein
MYFKFIIQQYSSLLVGWQDEVVGKWSIVDSGVGTLLPFFQL